MARRPGSSRGGFLLLETLLTVLVLTAGLAIVVRSFASSVEALAVAGDFTRALLLLEEKMWELEARGVITPGTTNGRFTQAEGNVQWEVTAASTAVPGLSETQVTVAWSRRGRPRSLSLVTYLKTEPSSETR